MGLKSHQSTVYNFIWQTWLQENRKCESYRLGVHDGFTCGHWYLQACLELLACFGLSP